MCLKPQSEVHTDEWAAYGNMDLHLPQKVAVHRVVNHSHTFVDPITGVHTQDIESKWNQLKQKVKQRRGIAKEDMQSFLNERMWREWKAGNADDIISNFINSISLVFTNIPV